MSEECASKKQDDGIPAWVMTFADLMSLLLAFFVLLFSFSEMDKNIYKELAGSLKEAFGVQGHAFCLMTNHVHLVVQSGEEVASLGRLMKRLAGRS